MLAAGSPCEPSDHAVPGVSLLPVTGARNTASARSVDSVPGRAHPKQSLLVQVEDPSLRSCGLLLRIRHPEPA